MIYLLFKVTNNMRQGRGQGIIGPVFDELLLYPRLRAALLLAFLRSMGYRLSPSRGIPRITEFV
jgi:hypothetical protein